jgi:hypothetical protein
MAWLPASEQAEFQGEALAWLPALEQAESQDAEQAWLPALEQAWAALLGEPQGEPAV